MGAQAERAYIRHPANVSIEVSPYTSKQQLNLQINNVSVGGLSFDSNEKFNKDTIVKLKIPDVKPVFKVNAIVRWCREQTIEQLDDSSDSSSDQASNKQAEKHYELGVEFLDTEDAFKVRMVEQVCHIGEYRKKMQQKQGKRVSWNKASEEWIAENAGNFPH